MSLTNYPPVMTTEVKTDSWTAPFWWKASEQTFVVATCKSCGKMRMPPGPFCPKCLDQRIEWTPLSGLGVIYSYTIVRRAITPEMKAHVPYVPAVVTLQGAQDLRLVGAVVESPIENISIDASVEVIWRSGAGGQLVPYFKLLG